MTWNSRDAMPKQRRGARGTEKTAPDAIDQPREPKPAPEAIPTFAATRAYQFEEEEETHLPWTQEFERDLAYEGIWPAREWSAWGRWMTRGVIPQ